MGADSSFAKVSGNCLVSQKERLQLSPQPSPLPSHSAPHHHKEDRGIKGPASSTHELSHQLKSYKKIPSHFCADTQDTSVREEGTSEPMTYRETESVFAKQRTIIEDHAKLHIGDFKIHGIIGGGSSAEILVASFKGSQQGQKQHYLAIKVINKKQVKSAEQLESLLIEEDILNCCNSEFIPKVYGTFSDEEHYYIAMEFAEGGDCYSLIKEDSSRKPAFQKTGQKGVRFLAGCVILGLQQLHSKNILYGDLKPENVLLFEDGYAKITDFGISKRLKKNQKAYLKSGSHLYLAPQFVSEEECGLELDLWSLGIFLYELANFKAPFDSEVITYLRSFLRNAKAFEDKMWHNDSLSPELKDLVRGLLKIEPKSRLGANGWQQIKEHPFFNAEGFDWQQLKAKRMESPLMPVLAGRVRFRQLKPVSVLSRSQKRSG